MMSNSAIATQQSIYSAVIAEQYTSASDNNAAAYSNSITSDG